MPQRDRPRKDARRPAPNFSTTVISPRRFLRVRVSGALLACAMAAANGAVAASPPRIAPASATGEFVPGQAVVRFAPNATWHETRAALRMAGVRPVRDLLMPGYTLVAFDAPVARALRLLRRSDAVAFAQPNRILRIQLGQASDPCLAAVPSGSCPSGWHLDAIAAQSGWARYPNTYYTPAAKLAIPAAQRVTVAVLDTAVQRANADFRNGGSSEDRALGGQLDITGMSGFAGVPQTFGEASYHGTYVAGLIGASANNGYAAAGVAYHADLLALSVVNGDSGATDTAKLADGIVYAHQRGARVINLSLGMLSSDAVVDASIRQVATGPNPALVVAAAGNAGNDQPFYPAWFDNVMAVGGTDALDRKASCSNYGSRISVVAPAKGVASITSTGFMTVPDCGTSAATPHVSALAAALIAQNPARTPAQVRSIIEQTADDLGAPGRDDVFGWGRINADRALSMGVGPQTLGLKAGPVRAGGGASEITATATAASVIRDAELFVGRQPAGSSDRGYPVRAADGAFDSPYEALAGTFTAGSLVTGPHRVFVRAMDSANQWGPVATAVLYVDGVRPVISQLAATNVVRPLDRAGTITFNATDDYATMINYDIEIMLAGQPGLMVHRVLSVSAPAGRQTITWAPRAIEAPGSYTVRITVRDGVANTTAASTTFLLV